MQSKLSPYGFDFGRFVHLLTRPNIGFPKPTGPHDNAFPDSGLIQLPNAMPVDLCDQAIADYGQFENFRHQKRCVIHDQNGRNLRVANFHLHSQSALKIGLNKTFHECAGKFFGAQSCIYTSLYFKHGSQQKAHVDTPFFWTRPFNLFVGVWVALEDVQPTAGPLLYYPGSHRFFASEQQLREVFLRANRDVQRMFELMRIEIENHCLPETVNIKKGDALIWHPGLMHGGSNATDPRATRHSLVFHFAPLGVNVRDHRIFPQNFINLPSYGVIRNNDGYYCRGKLPTAMI
jgi:ectoine hydroxylase-related dioxygenase (phytanoyl-CoA dioxygenase family)